ncbi:cytochrome P450, partial [Kitasatospora nipponensis]|uniref:cytochrome P450 n=1 Tax=Kitasatospora nipponensis TaxID=258049 RepID=UPI0031DD4353
PDPRVAAVGVLAEALGLVEPDAVARAIAVVAGRYFGGNDPAADAAADAAVAWLPQGVAGPDGERGGGPQVGPERAANRIGLLVQACDATGALVENARRHPAGPGDALAETVRHDPPVLVMRRVAASEVRVGGVAIARGDLVVLDVAAANRDPEVFTDPDAFDPDRSGPRSLTFGAGPRVCPGRAHALALAAGLLDRDHRAETQADRPAGRY